MAKLTPSHFEYNTASCRPGRTHPRVQHRIANQHGETASCRIHIIRAQYPFLPGAVQVARQTCLAQATTQTIYSQAQPSNDSREPIISQANSITTSLQFPHTDNSNRRHLPLTNQYLALLTLSREKQTNNKTQKTSSASPHHPVATRIRQQPKSAAHRPTTLKVPDQGASATNTPIRLGKERQSAVFKLKALTRESPLLPALAASSNYTHQRHLHRPCPPTTRILSPLSVFFSLFRFPPLPRLIPPKAPS